MRTTSSTGREHWMTWASERRPWMVLTASMMAPRCSVGTRMARISRSSWSWVS